MNRNHSNNAPFLALLLTAAALATPPVSRAESTKVLVGAIRWDAWQENGVVQAAVEKSLAPNHWHYRLPYFAKVTGPNSVVINGNSQAIMDRGCNGFLQKPFRLEELSGKVRKMLD